MRSDKHKMSRDRTPNLTVRSPQSDDIIKLTENLMPEVSVEQMNRRWEEHRHGYRELLIAELDGEAVGAVSVTDQRHQLPNSLRMIALDVGMAFRRKGVGTALMEAVEEQARRLGFQRVNLEVGVSNRDAMRLYERRGYERLGAPKMVANEMSWIMIKRV
jgi:ribosomal protein S18 acetylase RimI-like enzyme